MKIKLLDCRVYIISPGENNYRDRLITSITRLIDYGFKHVHYVKSIPDTSKTNSLSKTTLWIMEQEMCRNDPFIIVDDDIQIHQIHRTVNVPDDASAVYLGLSHWIYPYKYETLKIPGIMMIQPIQPKDLLSVDDDICRIYGMCGSHAILFLDRNFIRDFRQKLESLLQLYIAHDLIYATQHFLYPVYALKIPVFYQDQTIGGQEEATKLIWKENTYEHV